jgi:transposase InsO family protein
MSKIHLQARTTSRTRAKSKVSLAPLTELAERYNVSVATVRKWKRRETPEDLCHRPHTLSTTLTAAQEAIVVELRRLVVLPLDDLLVITREFINPHFPLGTRPLPAPPKTFKDYEPGFVHVDIKYLPQMPDEAARRYLFVAIDRAKRWVFLRIYVHQSEASSTDFLRRLCQAAPMKIQTVLTDNGSRFTSRTKTHSGEHAFDQRCQTLGIEHRMCPPRDPQTNGMVERFNGRISEVIAQTRFACAEELETTLTHSPAGSRSSLTRSGAQAVAHSPTRLFVKRVLRTVGIDIRSFGEILDLTQ